MNAVGLIEAMQSGKVFVYPRKGYSKTRRCVIILDNGTTLPTQVSTLMAAAKATDMHVYKHLMYGVEEYVLASKDDGEQRRWRVRVK